MAYDIPNYTLLKKIGEGAMAEVWLAEHKRNRRKAAIKVLKPGRHDDGEAELLFLREGEVLAAFDDNNIVKIYDNDKIGDLAFLAMEYLTGGTLLERMQRGPISVGETLGLVVQIAGALETAHRHKIIHRDLKPANIMLRDETTPVLTDFGAVRVLNRSTIYGRDGGTIGTPLYMSPEQITGQPLSGSSDLYALGVIFHQLLTGRLPFPGGSIDEIATQHLYAPLPQLPTALAMLQPVLEKLLAKKPADRYATAQDFINGLRQVFLNDEALRRQVGFAGTTMAWSSQLRALGFALDVGQLEEVRRAQGQQLPEPTRPSDPRPQPVAADAPTRRPQAHPVAERAADRASETDYSTRLIEQIEAPESAAPRLPALLQSTLALLRQRRVWLSAVVVVIGLSLLVVFLPRASAPLPAPVAVAVPVSQVLDARERYREQRRRLQALAVVEQTDVSAALAPAEKFAQGADTQLDQGEFAAALSGYEQASATLKKAALALLDELEQSIARRAQGALDDGRVAVAQVLLERGKAIRAQKLEWQPPASPP